MAEPKAKKARQQLTLVLQPQVPRFPFVNNFFNVTVHLFDDSNQVKSGDELEFPLQVRLLLDDKTRTVVDGGIVDVNPPMPMMTRTGKASFQVRVRDVSMSFDNRDFLLHVAPMPNTSKFFIAPVISEPMTVIRYRLRIRPESQPPVVWYKDEGGRDKCIEITVDLVDLEGRRVSGQQEVPVKVTLLYEDNHIVGRQDILKLSADSRQVVDESGSATLRLRIEDVSKNHQSKGFIIKVGPDTQISPHCSDISPDTSTSISVRSKRNRRSRQGGRPDDDISLVGHALSRGGTINSIDLPPSMALPGAPLSDGPLPPPDQKGLDPNSPVLKALSNVINWTRTVVNGLYQIQWQLIGYESKPDGSPDITRPLFNIHNPNTIVTSILQAYRTETMDNLRYLVQTLESGSVVNPTTATPNGDGPNGVGAYPPHAPFQAGAGGSQGSYPPSDGAGVFPHPHPHPHAQAQGEEAMDTAGNNGGSSGGGFGEGGGGGGGAFPPPRAPGLPFPAPSSSAIAGADGNGFGPSSGPSSEAPPPAPPALPRAGLNRGRSGIYGDGIIGGGGSECNVGMLPLVRESTYDLLAGMDPSWFAMDGLGAQLHEPSGLMELQVHAVVAKVYFSNAYGELGFPAFDHKHTLLGFYREGRNDAGQTVALYVPLPPGFTDAERRGVSDMLREEMNKAAGAVVTIANDDLTMLKERVLTYHWSRSQGFEADDASAKASAAAAGAGAGAMLG